MARKARRRRRRRSAARAATATRPAARPRGNDVVRGNRPKPFRKRRPWRRSARSTGTAIDRRRGARRTPNRGATTIRRRRSRRELDPAGDAAGMPPRTAAEGAASRRERFRRQPQARTKPPLPANRSRCAEAAAHAGGDGETAEHGSHEDAHGETARGRRGRRMAPTRPEAKAPAWRGRRGGRRDRRIGRRRRCARGSARPRAAPPPPVQNSGSHQAPADHAGAGGEGRARHQGRGADDLSVARRPLFGADAEHRARRRHQPQDHQRRGPHRGSKKSRNELEVPDGMGVIIRTAGASRTKTEIKRDFEYLLRLWETRARSDPEIHGAEAGLRRRLADQALDPRSLFQGYRRNHRRRRRRPTTRPKTSCACSCRAMPRT